MTDPNAVPTSEPPATPAAVLALAPGYSVDAAAGAISWALSQVEAYCERRFQPRQSTVTVTAHGGVALLPDPPVTSITSVEAFVRWPLGTVAAPSWQLLDADSYHCTADGELTDTRAYLGVGVPWPLTHRGLKVVYNHGFATWPQAVIDTVVALAVGYLANPAGMSERRVLDTTYRWMPGVGAAGIVNPLSGVDRYVLREVS